MSAQMPDFKKMSPEEVAKYIQERRDELQATQVAAKAVGVVVKDPAKAPKADKDRLDWLFERFGYQTGMRKWADGRMGDLQGRIEAVLKVAPLDPEAAGHLLAQASEGFRTARIGTSFDSTSMPDKKEAPGVPTGEVFEELMGEWRKTLGPIPEFLLHMLGGIEVEDQAPPAPKDAAMFPKPTEEAPVDSK